MLAVPALTGPSDREPDLVIAGELGAVVTGSLTGFNRWMEHWA